MYSCALRNNRKLSRFLNPSRHGNRWAPPADSNFIGRDILEGWTAFVRHNSDRLYEVSEKKSNQKKWYIKENIFSKIKMSSLETFSSEFVSRPRRQIFHTASGEFELPVVTSCLKSWKRESMSPNESERVWTSLGSDERAHSSEWPLPFVNCFKCFRSSIEFNFLTENRTIKPEISETCWGKKILQLLCNLGYFASFAKNVDFSQKKNN